MDQPRNRRVTISLLTLYALVGAAVVGIVLLPPISNAISNRDGDEASPATISSGSSSSADTQTSAILGSPSASPASGVGGATSTETVTVNQTSTESVTESSPTTVVSLVPTTITLPTPATITETETATQPETATETATTTEVVIVTSVSEIYILVTPTSDPTSPADDDATDPTYGNDDDTAGPEQNDQFDPPTGGNDDVGNSRGYPRGSTMPDTGPTFTTWPTVASGAAMVALGTLLVFLGRRRTGRYQN